jgi:hypothetical protein
VSTYPLREKFGIPDNIRFGVVPKLCKNLEKLYKLIAKNLPEDVPKELWLQNAIKSHSGAIGRWVNLQNDRNYYVGHFINDCFTWSETPQGSRFWSTLYEKYDYTPLEVKYKWGQAEYNVEITKIII